MGHLMQIHKSITTLQGEDIVFLATDINLPGKDYICQTRGLVIYPVPPCLGQKLYNPSLCYKGYEFLTCSEYYFGLFSIISILCVF